MNRSNLVLHGIALVRWLPICVVLCLLWPVAVQGQESSAIQWIEKGYSFLEVENDKEAERAFREAIRVREDDRAEAYVGLGRTAMLKGKWGQAGKYFNLALKDEPNYLPALYYQAVSSRELARHDVLNANALEDNADALFESLVNSDSLFEDVLHQYSLLKRSQGKYVEAIGLGHRQIKLKPELVEPYTTLLKTYNHFTHFGKEDQVAQWLNDHPSPYASLVWGETLRKDNSLDEAESVFRDLLGVEDDLLPESAVHLAMARVHFQAGRDRLAQFSVDQAIDRIESALDAAFVVEDFKHILTDAELGLYRTLDAPDHYQAFFRAIWERRDPMPARRVNVRLKEHYRRLRHAEENYLFYGDRLWHNDPDKLGILDFPAVYALNEEFNDAGLIYIRHGDPDDKIRSAGDETDLFKTNTPSNRYTEWTPGERMYFTDYALNESWRYNEPRMDFHFVVEGSEGNNWRLIPVLPSFSMLESREHWGPPYSTIVAALRTREEQTNLGEETYDYTVELENVSNDSTSATSIVVSGTRDLRTFQGKVSRLDLEIEDARRDLEDVSTESVTLALSTDRQTWDEEVEPMPVPYAVAAFRGEDGRTELDVYYALPVGQISKKMDPSEQRFSIETGIALHDMQWNVVAETTEVRRFPNTSDETAAAVDFYRARVSPDSYHVALHGLPEGTPLLGGVKFDYQAPDFTEDRLMLSDLLLASLIRPITNLEKSRYVRKGFKINSNPFQRYAITQPVFVYFEVYNLTYNTDDQTSYQIEYILTPDSAGKNKKLFKRNKRAILSLKVDRAGDTASPVEYAEFDVKDVDPGDYLMTVRLTDLVTGQVEEQSIPLQLTEKP